MRVVRVIGVLEPGGAQLSMLRLARAQAALGVQTRLLAGDATPQGLALARHFGMEAEALQVHDEIGHSVRQWTPDPRFSGWLAPRLESADLVHAHMLGAWWAAAAAMPSNVPLIASEHNAVTWPIGNHAPVVADAAPRIDLFFVHGPGPRLFVHEIGVDAAKVMAGRSAIAVNRVPRPGLVSPRLTFTGRLREDKGPDLLVRAVALLKEPPVTYLVGDGPMRQEVGRLVDRLGLTRTVRLMGWSYEPSRYVAGSAVHLVPSREEAWSQSAVTAMALGVPVVATAVDGLPVTLADRRGLLVDPEPAAIAEGIQSVLDGSAATDTEGARRYAAAFHPASVAAYYLTAYRRALAGQLTPAD